MQVLGSGSIQSQITHISIGKGIRFARERTYKIFLSQPLRLTILSVGKRPRESVQLSLSTTVASSHMISQPTIHTHRLVSAKQLYWVAQSAAAQIQILVEVDLAQLTYKDI